MEATIMDTLYFFASNLPGGIIALLIMYLIVRKKTLSTNKAVPILTATVIISLIISQFIMVNSSNQMKYSALSFAAGTVLSAALLLFLGYLIIKNRMPDAMARQKTKELSAEQRAEEFDRMYEEKKRAMGCDKP